MIERIYILLEIFSIIVCLFALYGEKIKFDIWVMGLVISDILIISLIDLGYLKPSASLLVYFLIFIFCIVEFKESIKVACVNNAIYILIVSVLQLIYVIPMAFLQGLKVSDGIKGTIINGLVLITVYLFKKQLHRMAMFVSKKSWMVKVAIVGCLFMVIIILIRYKIENNLPVDIYIAGLILIIMVVLLMNKWQKAFELAKANEMELKVSSIYINAYEELVVNMKKRQHDINNHLNAMYSQHYTCNTYDELVESQKKYCGYIERSFEFYNLLSIKIPVLGGFLYSKFKEISEKGIEIESEICIKSSEINIPIYELIAVIGVLLDNAMEAVEGFTPDDRIIRFYGGETSKDIRISVKNKAEYISEEKREYIFEEGYSSKGKNRGYGLSNVKEKALKYGFGVVMNNENIEGENWVSFELIFYK